MNTGQTWQISYGDGSTASGNVYFDIVKVGATTVTSQAVELAQTISPQFEADVDNDGILGLAMDSLNQVYPDLVRTFFSNAIPTLASPLFTANLKKGKPGNFNFGYINKSEYTGSITYVPITTVNGFWEFNSSGYAIGNSAFVSASIDGIADTGTTVVYLPPAIVSAYYTKVSGAKYVSTQGGYTFPCSATTPSLTLGIGSYKTVIPGSYLNYAPATPTSKPYLEELIYDDLTFFQPASVASSGIQALDSLFLEIFSSNHNLLFSICLTHHGSVSLPNPLETATRSQINIGNPRIDTCSSLHFSHMSTVHSIISSIALPYLAKQAIMSFEPQFGDK